MLFSDSNFALHLEHNLIKEQNTERKDTIIRFVLYQTYKAASDSTFNIMIVVEHLRP